MGAVTRPRGRGCSRAWRAAPDGTRGHTCHPAHRAAGKAPASWSETPRWPRQRLRRLGRSGCPGVGWGGASEGSLDSCGLAAPETCREDQPEDAGLSCGGEGGLGGGEERASAPFVRPERKLWELRRYLQLDVTAAVSPQATGRTCPTCPSAGGWTHWTVHPDSGRKEGP